MISAFGVVSLAVFVISIYALILHYKLMKIRTAMDENLSNLEFLQQEENSETAEALHSANNAINAYNAHISRFPAKFMAIILGFSLEKPI
ncbi:MAG: hypothetical protein FWF78_04775 [Defluviitaleaceae bacterium]|nr:hypothetical protein [Defluviitaleaceae bacterium]